MFPGAMPQAFTLYRVAAKRIRNAIRGDGSKTGKTNTRNHPDFCAAQGASSKSIPAGALRRQPIVSQRALCVASDTTCATHRLNKADFTHPTCSRVRRSIWPTSCRNGPVTLRFSRNTAIIHHRNVNQCDDRSYGARGLRSCHSGSTGPDSFSPRTNP